ncbi:MAG: hypothetical protein A2Z16_02250 [Chloroflexi bacterium RBG_16_54_18]|nr:MAG: hypothetical protein A2Z16_02250 [Chloroflexi bacterium RBG_16_54_18]
MRFSRFLCVFFCLVQLAAGCSQPQADSAAIAVEISADGQTQAITVPPGSTVEKALQLAGIELEARDRTDPQLLAILNDEDEIQVIRVTESFEVRQEIIPFESQVLKNEALPQDQEYLVQAGINGLKEITYRRVFEDGIEQTGQPVPVNTVILEEPVPEIRMVGVQAPFAPLQIPGRIVYLRDGNVWMMENSTANRRALLTTGDLDGRIFTLSRDGAWLLFSRKSTAEGQINSLWVVNLQEIIENEDGLEANLIDLKVPDVVHFADFSPIYADRVIFSTVEPRTAAPGWQANNDLVALTYSDTGWTTDWSVLVQANSGGIYGWWGMDFLWSPDGSELAYTRPDGIGLVDFETSTYTNTIDITPWQAHGDWAWVPGISWSPDSKTLYTVAHPAQGSSVLPEASQRFDLAAGPISSNFLLPMVAGVGMFAYPLASPLQELANGIQDYQIAFLQALSSAQSETSRYRVGVMNRDGTNRRLVFPADDNVGMSPDQYWGAWAPAPLPESGDNALGIIYQGNLWILDLKLNNAVQVTGDELTTRLIWTIPNTILSGS